MWFTVTRRKGSPFEATLGFCVPSLVAPALVLNCSCPEGVDTVEGGTEGRVVGEDE